MNEQDELLSLRIMVINQIGRERIDIWAAATSQRRLVAWIDFREGGPCIVRCPLDCSLPKFLVERLAVLCYRRIERERLLWGPDQDRADIVGAERWLPRLLPPTEAAEIISFFRKDHDV